MNKKKMILALAGEIASGKGTIAKYLEKKYSGSSHRFSTILRDVLDRLYLEHSRENMQKLSTILRQNFSEDILSKVMTKDIKKDNYNVIAIDGIRRLADIKSLRELPEFKLVYIEADIKKRYKRIVKRGENPDDKTKSFADFKKEHKQESELQIRKLKKEADFVINNDGTLQELYIQIDQIIKNLK